ncbi:lactosylceramide 4-alpha-galactosyltransferase-like [Cloeon dipterum]|uniref:lactosylceramide 4-alpha-galactosyltransferase-like n=1 Tax=Cloeon dipterum TaxID=197152 RepID=UPI00321F917C
MAVATMVRIRNIRWNKIAYIVGSLLAGLLFAKFLRMGRTPPDPYAIDYTRLNLSVVVPLRDLTPYFKTDNTASPFEDTSNTVFFIESVGDANLSSRQLCAVESLSRSNPEVNAVIVYLQPVREIEMRRNAALMKVLKAAKNKITLATIDASLVLSSSPVFHSVASKILKDTPFRVNHLSDFLRMLLLWRFGGFYMDMDTIIYHSLDDLFNAKNFLVTGADDSVSPFFFGFRKNHPMLGKIMDAARDDYIPNYYASVPASMGSVLSKHYGMSVRKAIEARQVDDVKIVNSTVFTPIVWDQFVEFFKDSNEDMVRKFLENGLGIHVWNYKSYGAKVLVNSTSPYTTLARLYCPRSFYYNEENHF